MSGSAKSDPLRSPNLTDADIERVSHHWGFNFARYLVLWDALEPTPGKIDMAYVDRIATDVKRLGGAGLRVMLDMHQDVYAAQFCCDGAPAWAVRDDGQPFELQKTWSFNYFQPAVTRAFDNFWDAKGKDADLQEHYATVWKALATRFAGDPHLIGYDLINEPYAGSDFEALEALSRVTPEDGGKSRIFDETKLGPFYQRMIDAIRAVDADHWIFVEPRYGAPGNGSPSFLPVLKDPRAGDLRIVQSDGRQRSRGGVELDLRQGHGGAEHQGRSGDGASPCAGGAEAVAWFASCADARCEVGQASGPPAKTDEILPKMPPAPARDEQPAEACSGHAHHAIHPARARGELGDGSVTSSSVPVGVTGLGSGVIAVSAGGRHTCAVTSGGAVQCWGFNDDGELGNGSTIKSSVPVPVLGLGAGVVGVSSGYYHACAVTSGGAVQCWGSNTHGQLGDGTLIDRSAPVAVVGLGSGVVAVSCGFDHTCALLAGGGVECWGDNLSGMLGDGSTIDSAVPVGVTGLGPGVVAIGAGAGSSCALTSTGKVQCWGYNQAGMLGDSTGMDSLVPVEVTGL